MINATRNSCDEYSNALVNAYYNEILRDVLLYYGNFMITDYMSTIINYLDNKE